MPALLLPPDVADVFLQYSLMNEAGHDILLKACRVAAPLMRKRNWKVHKLSEFYPASAPQLLGLNINRGREVKIRLRSAEHSFLEYESVLHTLLHELVHIVHGPHSVKFYDMLEELVREAEMAAFRHQHNIADLEGKYWGAGQRLGAGGRGRGGGRNLASSSSGAVAVAAAVPVPIMAGRGVRLGGTKRVFGVSAKEAARLATLKRLQDDDVECCGTLITLDDDDDEEEEEVVVATSVPPPPAPKRALLDDESLIDLTGSNTPTKPPPPAAATTSAAVVVFDLTDSQQEEEKPWACPRCTFSNSARHLQCLACNKVKD